MRLTWALRQRNGNVEQRRCADSFAGIYLVRTRAFKELLASRAELLVRRLLDHIRNTVRNCNIKINEEYQVRGTA